MMKVTKHVFDELTFCQNGDYWTARMQTEEMADEVMKRCNMHDAIVRCIEEMRDRMCDEMADPEDIPEIDRALDLLKQAEE